MSKPTRMKRSTSPFSLLIAMMAMSLSPILFACTDEGGSATTTHASSSDSGSNASTPSAAIVSKSAGSLGTPHVHAEGETAPRNPNERPIPAFKGRTTQGETVSISDLLGSRILLFFFNPETDAATPLAKAVATISSQSGAHNFKILGIAVGTNTSALSRFAAEQNLNFPIIDDSDASITRLLRLRSPNALIGVDAEGYMDFGLGNFPTEGDVAATVVDTLRESLRLPTPSAGSQGELYSFPQAPALGVISMSNGERLETEDFRGQAAIVIFFLHTCPHCHHALASIKTTLASIPKEQRPRLVAISIQNAPSAVRSSLKDLGLDYFDPYLDPGGEATERWGVTGGVPVVLVLDKEGRIRHRSSGWNEKRDPGLIKMKAAKAAGARVPMLLEPTGYSGNDVCGVCHEQEYAAWQFTSHATAYDTLVAHASDRRTDCVGCHVVGFEEKGGFNFKRQPVHLEGVGCESCHGRGGPHLSPTFVPRNEAGHQDYQQVCATCHNPKHSLGFEYAIFHQRISHKEIASLSDEARADLLGGSGPSRNLLPTRADYVGSDACQSCHTAEFSTWETSAHGHAVETLERTGKESDTDCLQCHTTAFGKTGGFPADAKVPDHKDLARVGCESCHGPGGDHIGEGVKRVGTILSLGDKCDSCVILKICGTCHDDANDPGFQFKVEERIETQRHGTIEAAATNADESADRALIRDAFARIANRDSLEEAQNSPSHFTSAVATDSTVPASADAS